MSQLNATKYDKKSIMLYTFPGNLIVGGAPTPNNNDISKLDKKFIAEMYPKAAPAATMSALEAMAPPMVIRKPKKSVVTAATFAEIVRDRASSQTPAAGGRRGR